MLTALFGIGSVFVLMIMFGLLGLLMDKVQQPKKDFQMGRAAMLGEVFRQGHAGR